MVNNERTAADASNLAQTKYIILFALKILILVSILKTFCSTFLHLYIVL